MGISATWLTLRSVLAKRWPSTLLLALLLGIAGGWCTAVLATASRIDGAYSRLINEVDAPNLLVEGRCDECPVAPSALLADAPAVDFVAGTPLQGIDLLTEKGERLGPAPEIPCATGAGDVGITSAPSTRSGHPPVRVVDGRLPTSGSLTEIAMPLITARRSDIALGDTLILATKCFGGEIGPPLDLRLEVVGIVLGPFDIRPPGTQLYFENVYADRALTDSLGVADDLVLAVWLDDGRTADDLAEEGRRFVVFDLAERRKQIDNSLRPDATALRLLAVVSVVAAIAVLGQLLMRHELLVLSGIGPSLAIGARRRDVWKVGALVGIVIAGAAFLIAMVMAVVARPIIPQGVADSLIGSSGFGSATLARGGLITLAVVAAIGALGSLIGARGLGQVVRAPAHPFGARLAERLRLRPPAALGVRVALEPGHAAHGVPVRTGLAAIAIALTAVVGATTFGASLDRLRTDTRYVGWNWDLQVYTEDAADLVQRLANDPLVAAVSAGTMFNFGLTFNPGLTGAPALISIDTGPGSIRPQVLRGRAPAGPGEILLAPGLASALDADIDDVVPAFVLREFGGTEQVVAHLQVVGIGVVPVVDGQLDIGAAMTLNGVVEIARSLGEEDASPHAVYIDLASSTDFEQFAAQLEAELVHYPDAFMYAGSPITTSEDLVKLDLSDAGWVPAAFGIMMGLTALAVLMHLVVTGSWARQRDLAIARSLGFVSRSIRVTIALQSVTLVLGGLLVAIPVGVILGRVAWTRYAEGLGVVPDALTPWGTLGVIAAACVIAALLVSVWPASRVVRRRPIEALRAE